MAPPDPKRPGGARIAVQIGIPSEAGGENGIEPGDAVSEAFLSEIVGPQPSPAWAGPAAREQGVDLATPARGRASGGCAGFPEASANPAARSLLIRSC